MNNSAASDTGVRCLCVFVCVFKPWFMRIWRIYLICYLKQNVYWISGKLINCHKLSCIVVFVEKYMQNKDNESFCQNSKEPAFSALDVSK